MKVPLPDAAGKERPEKESLMNEKQERMMDLRMKGYCCSQIVMQLGLDHLGKENPDLIAASAGLCDGMYSGKTCGILSAAICLLYLADPEEASMSAVSDLTDWFEATFEATDCTKLLGDDPAGAKMRKCPMMLEARSEEVPE